MISSNYGTAGPGTAALSQMRQQLYAKLDANADGGIDETEFVAGATSGSSSASTWSRRRPSPSAGMVSRCCAGSMRR